MSETPENTHAEAEPEGLAIAVQVHPMRLYVEDGLIRIVCTKCSWFALHDTKATDPVTKVGLAGKPPTAADDVAVRAEDAIRLLGAARMVLDRCAEQRDGFSDEAADLSQRIVDVIGHGVTDEPPVPRYLCWCDGTACSNPTSEPFTVCDECTQFGHRALASDGLRPEDVVFDG